MPSSSSSSSPPPTTKSNIWSDLPRRLATICIGFPLVWKMLSHPTLALIFFVGAHALVTREFALLEPLLILEPEPSQTTKNNTKSKSTTTTTMNTTTTIGTSSFLLFSVASLLLAHVQSDALFQLSLSCIAGTFVWIQRRHWILGLVLVTIPFRAWYALCGDFASTISLLLVVWNCDTGALVVGRLSTKLLPLPPPPPLHGDGENNRQRQRRLPVPTWIRHISPAKSMEGFIGGLLGGTWTAVSWIPLLIQWCHVETTPAFDSLWITPSLGHRILLGMSLSFLAIVGDLVESSIKRQSHSKDSGSFLPGHGGILDRFDSSLLAVLLYQALLEWTAAAAAVE
jgi:CDP-diglyceride synthetase